MPVVEETGMSESTTYQASSDVSNEFSYTPMSPLAPIGLLLSLIGLTAFYGFYGIFVAFLAAIVCGIAVRKISAAEGALTGGIMARIGLVLSVVATVGGAIMFSWAYSTECPEGYERHNFPREIAEKQFAYAGRQRLIHPDVEPLLNKPIFIKGYVYQTRSTRSQRDFILLKDSGDCCFGGDPAAYDMIQITLSEDHEPVDFPMLSMVSVAGVLKADPDAPDGLAVYTMIADKTERARTSF